MRCVSVGFASALSLAAAPRVRRFGGGAGAGAAAFRFEARVIARVAARAPQQWLCVAVFTLSRALNDAFLVFVGPSYVSPGGFSAFVGGSIEVGGLILGHFSRAMLAPIAAATGAVCHRVPD